MAFKVILLLACFGFLAVSATPLPDYLKPCSRSDPKLNECAKKHGEEAISTILKGDKRFGLPPLVPLSLPEVKVVPSDTLTINLRDCTLFGIDTVKLRDLDIDLDKRKVSVRAETGNLNLQGTYDVKGRILVLPIVGNGPANISTDGGIFTYTFDFDLVPKKGKNYIDVKEPRIEYQFKRIYFHLDNLFNGDKRLGDQMNIFLNENWEDVAKDLSPIISETINVIVTSIFKGYTNRVPYEDFFLP